MRKSAALLLLAAALLLSACGGGGSSSGASSSGSGGSRTSAGGGAAETAGGGAPTPAEVWAKEVEGVMRQFENSSAKSVELIHTSTSQYNLEPIYATYSDELTRLGKQLEATEPPANCERSRDEMGDLARKVSGIMGVLANQDKLSPEEYSALVYQQSYKFAHVGRKLTTMTIDPHC